MKLIWYYFVKYYIRIGFLFYFKNIRLKDAQNIPKKKAVLFVSNHQNALIDPLLIGAFTQREMYFLTRSNVFSNSLIRSLLASVNMLPVYRMRDGIETLKKNDAVFQQCYQILKNKGSILIFPEGNHNIQRRVRILSKGFTRIVFGAIEQNNELEIDIIPIGINYTYASKFASSLSIYFGEPIAVNPFYDKKNIIKSTNDLKIEVRNRLKKLTTHIEESSQYDQIVSCFTRNEFLFPEKVNQQIENLDQLKHVNLQENKSFNPLQSLVILNSIFPWLIWKYIYPNIKEEEFISTFRFSVGITIFPFFYLLQTWIIMILFGKPIAFLYLIFCFSSVYILKKIK